MHASQPLGWLSPPGSEGGGSLLGPPLPPTHSAGQGIHTCADLTNCRGAHPCQQDRHPLPLPPPYSGHTALGDQQGSGAASRPPPKQASLGNGKRRAQLFPVTSRPGEEDAPAWPGPEPGPERGLSLGKQGPGILGGATPSPAPEKTVPKPQGRLCPWAPATPAGVPTKQAAGARRGGGTEVTQNPHLLPPPQPCRPPPQNSRHPGPALPCGHRAGAGEAAS